jgi:hypothetical protein
MRQGDFSELLNRTTYIAQGFQRQQIPVFIKDPQSANPCTVADQSGCFAGNIIQPNRLSPNGVGILNAWPVPNLTSFIGGGNWFAAKLHTFDQRKDTAAVDVNLTERQRLRFRATNYAYLEYQPLDGNTDRTPKFFNRPNKTGSLDYVWTISPSKVNEVLITASQDIVRIPVDAANFFDRTQACAQSTCPAILITHIYFHKESSFRRAYQL